MKLNYSWISNAVMRRKCGITKMKFNQMQFDSFAVHDRQE